MFESSWPQSLVKNILDAFAIGCKLGLDSHAQSIALVANGALQESQTLRSLIQSYPFIVALDGGLAHCSRLGILPNLILGDLDSVSGELLDAYSNIPIQRYSTEKDQSDLELALKWVESKEADKITVFGALGLRTDHTLANLQVLRRYPQKVFFESEQELVFSCAGSLEIPCQYGQTISFFSIGEPALGVNSKGLKWELRDAEIGPAFFSFSNICLADAILLSIKQGDLICCIQKTSCKVISS